MDKFFMPFIFSFGLSLVLSWAIIFGGKRILKFLKRTGERHIHNKQVVRLGGIALVLSFVGGVFFSPHLVITPEIWGFIAAIGLILIVGTLDDLREMFWKIQFFFQIISVLIIFIAGVRMKFITNFWTGETLSLESEMGVIVSVFLIIFWVILLMNVMNWTDGVDGLSGSITLIASLTIMLLSLKPEVNQPPIAIMAAVLAGSTLGFLFFNFFPARILAGTSGANFFGFSLAVISIFSGTKIATAILVLIVPIIDFLWVILERFRKRKSIFLPDKSHIHFKLLDLGWSPVKINLLFSGITALAAILALNTRTFGKIVTILLSGILVLAFLFFIDRKIKLRNQNAS
ncbi:MAG: MraY family glycosyltransferase [Patescibacteria group bacterium]